MRRSGSPSSAGRADKADLRHQQTSAVATVCQCCFFKKQVVCAQQGLPHVSESPSLQYKQAYNNNAEHPGLRLLG